tara:strand:- start:875 stop:2323 length:1449 start_codon:yes stop_codon:yes gene_type:complete
MTTVVGNKILKNVGQTEATLLSTDANTRFTVIGLSFTNVSDSVVFVDAFLNSGYYMKDVMLPVGSSLRAISAGEKLTMGFNSNFTVSASSNDAIDVIASFASIIEAGLPEEVQLVESTGIAIRRDGNYISVGIKPQEIEFGFAADDSTIQYQKVGESIRFIGASNITTTSDTEGNITIAGPDLTAYVQNTANALRIAADDNVLHNKTIGSNFLIKGTQNVTTSSDASGDITISGPDLTSYVRNIDTSFRITTDDSQTKNVSINDNITFKGENNITTSKNSNGDIVISGPTAILNIAANDLTYRSLSLGANFAIKAGTNISTASDTNGNITVTGPDLTPYIQNTDVAWRKGDQAGTYQNVIINEAVQFRGYNGITVAHITEGIGIYGPSVLWRISADDDQYKTVSVNQDIKIIGGTGINTSSDANGNITINSGGGGIALGDISNVTTTNPQNNDILVYNGNQWVNTPNTAGDLDPIVAAIALG